MDKSQFNFWDDKGNNAVDAARTALALLAGAAAVRYSPDAAGLLWTGGKVNNVPLKTILKNRAEYNQYTKGGGYNTINPEMLSRVYATDKVPQSFTSRTDLAENYSYGDEIPNTLQPDGYNDVEIVYQNPVTGKLSYRPKSSYINNKGKLKLPMLKIKQPDLPAGSVMENQALKDLVNYNKGKPIKYLTEGKARTKKGAPLLDDNGNVMFRKNQAPAPFGNRLRMYDDSELAYLDKQLKDAFVHNTTKVPMSQLFQERITEGVKYSKGGKLFGRGGKYSRNANKAMDAKLNKNAAHRKMVSSDLNAIADSTGIDRDKIINAYAFLSHQTDHAGALDRLGKAIDVHYGEKLPEFRMDAAGRPIIPYKDAQDINTAAQFFGPFGTGEYNGSKKNILSEVIKNQLDSTKGIDSAVIDKVDILKGLARETSRSDTMPNYIFGSEPIYNDLLDQTNNALGSGFINDFLSKYADGKLSNIQQILRRREYGSN